MAVKEKDIWDATLRCPTCGKPMRKSVGKLGGTSVRMWKCSCGDGAVHPEDAEKALTANKLRLGVRLKIGELNKAPYVRFSKDFSDLLHKGSEAVASMVSPDEIRLKIVKRAQ
jgi:hypothetical protein